MSLIVTGKGDLDRLVKFEESDFSDYELYLGLFDEESYRKIISLPDYIKISSIHNPTRIKINNQIKKFNLLGGEGIRKESFKSLQETIKLTEQVNGRIVVIHGARYNPNLSKEEAFSLLVKGLNQLDVGEVKLCFENDALWHNTFYSGRVLLASVDDFKKLDSLLGGKLKITADIEHLRFSFYFSRFVGYIGGENKFMEQYPKDDTKQFEEKIQKFIKENYEELNEKFKDYLSSFFTTFKDKIEHIHLSGSDPYNFVFDSEMVLPLIGEHLPLGFNDGVVKDKLDYDHLMELVNILPKEKRICIVLEVWRKNPEEFILKMRESKQFLIKYLNNNDGVEKMADDSFVSYMQAAQKFDSKKKLNPKRKSKMKIVSSFVKPTDIVLDVGAWDGTLLPFLKLNKEDQYFGVDLHKIHPRVMKFDVTKNKLPFQEKIFDVIFLLDILEHLENPLFVLNNLKQNLKPGGKIIITVPCAENLNKMIVSLLNPKKYLKKFSLEHINCYGMDEIMALVTRADLKIECLKKINARIDALNLSMPSWGPFLPFAGTILLVANL